MNKNKVAYGLKLVHYSVGTEKPGGTIEWAAPVALPGAVKLGRDIKTETTNFIADDSEYHTFNLASGDTLDLNVAKFTDEFKKNVLGYANGSNGELIEVKGVQAKRITLIFQEKGDKEDTRYIMFNCIPGAIKKEWETMEPGKPKVMTESISLTFVGINVSGKQIGLVEVTSENTNYNTLFTTAPAITVAPGI